MPEPIQYYMDQHIPAAVTQGLAQHGINVLTAQDAGQCGEPDGNQLAFATKEQRVMVTYDSDYLALHQSGVEHAGIAWCPARKYRAGQLIQALLLIHGVLDRESMKNNVEFM